MKGKILAGALVAMMGLGMAGAAMAAPGAHAHIDHVATGWTDTPGQAGLLETAMKEAKIAAQHAGFAASRPDDLAWMKTHANHVLHALDPSRIAKGPGMGYGVIRAASGVAKHINFAASSDDASKNVKLHAKHVATSAENTVARAREMVALIERIEAARTAGEAAPLVAKLNRLAKALTDGIDANGDGKVTWVKGEGGLKVAKKHLTIMMKGEGM